MNFIGGKVFLTMVVFSLLIAVPAFPQAQTGAITGRAMDNSGGIIPAVEVTITSPAMIGGAHSANRRSRKLSLHVVAAWYLQSQLRIAWFQNVKRRGSPRNRWRHDDD